MPHVVLELQPGNAHGCCGYCGKRTCCLGPHLVELFTLEPVCRDCGRKHAPAVAALLDLATVAQRVGRIGRHSVSPPLAALLDLARAAENYASAHPPRRETAAAA